MRIVNVFPYVPKHDARREGPRIMRDANRSRDLHNNLTAFTFVFKIALSKDRSL
jgi:hypothetical protein